MPDIAEVKVNDKHFVLIRESLLQSIVLDLKTFFFVGVIIGVGIYCKSAAMQWIGFLMLIIMAAARANPSRKCFSSIDEACAWLRKEGGE